MELAELNDAIQAGVDDEEVRDNDEGPGEECLGGRERVYLVGVQIKARRQAANAFSVKESLAELGRLADTAGLLVIGSTYQMVDKPSPRSYIGSGKVAEIAAAVRALSIDTVIFDDELSPGQQRNLEKALGEKVRIADRTMLILDIFEQRARTHEGRLQVELAAVTYQLPRLKRMWTHLERQMGSGAMRSGMGESQMEVDRRLLRDKIVVLKKEIESVRSHRKAYRKRRKDAHIPVVALVGYTNAGKSTLLNTITQASVHAEDTLFATLDPTTRKATLPSGKEVLFSDTVGFIQKLPTQLVAAFRATLEEIEEADVLLHVVDLQHADAGKQAATVFKVLEEMHIGDDIPMVTAWNKIDACTDPSTVLQVASTRPETVALSAQSGFGISDLMVMIEAAIEESMVPFEALIPYSDGAAVNLLREQGIVRKEEYTGEGVRLLVSADLSVVGRVTEYVVAFVPKERVFSRQRDQVPPELGGEGAGEAVDEDEVASVDRLPVDEPVSFDGMPEKGHEQERRGGGGETTGTPEHALREREHE